MKKTLTILTILLAGWAVSALSQTEHYVQKPVVAPSLTSRQYIWIDALAWCESNGNPDIINPKDSDGTPSYGMFSFKPATYAMYAKKIKLASTTDYMNEEGQRKIVEFMIIDPNTNLRKQFPGCTRKLGLPPKSDTI